MARPTKENIEYFSHDIKGGKTLFMIESRFGNDGYAFWFKLLELLGDQPGLSYDCTDSPSFIYLAEKAKVSEEKAEEILDFLATLNAIDADLWHSDKVIWVQNFANRLEDLYARRKKEVPEKPQKRGVIATETVGYCNNNPTKQGVISQKQGVIATETPQSKVKESKEKKKENTPLTPRKRGEPRTVSDDFEKFWAAYPRKTAKKNAVRAWQKLKPDEPTLDTVLNAIENQKKSEQWQRDGGQYIPHPATWLNQCRWEDEIEVRGIPPKPSPKTGFEGL
jgi:hypothetical protein